MKQGTRSAPGLLLAVAALGAAAAVAADPPAISAAAPAPIKRTLLTRADVPGSNQEVVYALVEIAAHATVPRHTHPGTVFGYLLDGDYTMLIDGQPARTLRPGEWLEVPAYAVHSERAGDRPARLLAVFTVEKGQPLTAPAP